MSRHYQPKGIHTANMPWTEQAARVRGDSSTRPFITIAQQIGAECPSLPRRLAETLNASGAGSPAWSCWDQELIEKVASENQIPHELITSLDTTGHSWVDDLLWTALGRPDEWIIFHRLRETIRSLADSGHAIIVGHGSTSMTHDLAWGLHVCLIAPKSVRIKNVAARFNFSTRKAERYIRRLGRRRKAFFTRFRLGRPLAPEMFAAVLNVAELDEPRLIRAIVAMLPHD